MTNYSDRVCFNCQDATSHILPDMPWILTNSTCPCLSRFASVCIKKKNKSKKFKENFSKIV